MGRKKEDQVKRKHVRCMGWTSHTLVALHGFAPSPACASGGGEGRGRGRCYFQSGGTRRTRGAMKGQDQRQMSRRDLQANRVHGGEGRTEMEGRTWGHGRVA